MVRLSPSLTLYSFIIIAKYVNGYFIFAVNLNDFENLVRKMLPAELAKRLSEIAANPNVLRQPTDAKSDKNEDSNSYDQSSDYEHVKTVSKDRNDKVSVSKTKRNFNRADVSDSQNINADQLAQEIKEKVFKALLSKLLRLKLAKELSSQKRKIKKVNKKQKKLREKNFAKHNIITTTNPSSLSIKQITKTKQKSTNITSNYGREYATPSQWKTDTDLIVEEIPIIEKTDLSPKADSYYDGREEAQDTGILTDSAEIKAQEPHQAELHTVKPTRQHFSWSSPNYYASLPTYAERYNFNESLPDKDRNRVRFKSIRTTPYNIIRKNVNER